MHAIHVTVATVDHVPDGHLDRIVADVSSRPGFVHGYWLEPQDGTGHAYAFFDTEEQARAKAPAIGAGPDGVQILDVEFSRVLASA
jgi:hypothetical protein